jgi:hypothetical protein
LITFSGKVVKEWEKALEGLKTDSKHELNYFHTSSTAISLLGSNSDMIGLYSLRKEEDNK